ncbi:MAG: ABC transporter substrate-binding protein [Planctomycetota bacterium]|jgi:ABC-type nitrate/sulfonate/bicarbonate transport system substrate-binding protein
MNKQNPSVRIGYLNIVTNLALFVAEEKGFLKDEGIEYKTIPVASSNQIVDDIVAGNLDCFTGASAVPVLAAELQSPGKLKVFSVSEITPQKPFDALLVKEDSPLKTLSDLSGRKIGVFPGSTAANLLKKYLGDKGIDASAATFVPIPPANHLAALNEGSVDAIFAYEPTIAIALSKGGVRQLHGSVYAEMLSPNPISVSVVSTAFLQEHPETAVNVIRVLERAMDYMKEQDTETRQILAKQMKLSEEAASRCVFLYMLGHEQIDSALFQKFADMLTNLGELKGHVKVDNLIYR